MQILTLKHPDYLPLVQKHVAANPANSYRIAVTAYRIRQSGKRVFMSIIHPLGGGAAQHARELMASTAKDVIWLNLRPMGSGGLVLECTRDGYQFSVALEPHLDYEVLAAVVKACGVERMHIHHLMGHGDDLVRLVRELQVPFDFTLHDYYTICPQVTLSDEHGCYCGEPDESGCSHCMARRPPPGRLVDITSWRAKHAWVLTDADRVIAPSADAGDRIRNYYPQARIIAAEHEGPSFCRIPTARPVQEGERLRVAVLGTMAIHKGFELLRDCSAYAKNSGMPIEFILLGNIEAGIACDRIAFTATGPYEAADLPSLLQEVAPHLVWFPARWPETFSYTLSACLESGLPVAAHRIGAFSERLAMRPWTWTFPANRSAVEWANFFNQVHRDHFTKAEGPGLSPFLSRALPDFYPDRYLKTSEPAPRPRPTDGRRAPVPVAAAVASNPSGQIQACGYVRIIQPLTHPILRDSIRLAIMEPAGLITAEADVILIQRDAVRDVETAERILWACKRRGSRLIYEIDDDLFQIPTEHPEHAMYSRITPAMTSIAAAADTVIASTEILRQKMLRFNANTVTLPNYLDDRLWKLGSGDTQFDAGAVRVLYMGTMSHRDDLEFLGRAVRNMNPAVRDSLSIDVIGVACEAESSGWFHPIRVPDFIAASYPRFVEWIQSRNVWHWGVAPLLDTPFNRCKSSLKFLEYAALRLPSLCSDVQPYREAVRHDETGLLVVNDVQEWTHALQTAAMDSQLWGRLRQQSSSVFCENTMAARAQLLRSQWIPLTSGRAASATAREGF
jgi:glycosyltransferase involved in cell wall biosynthesis